MTGSDDDTPGERPPTALEDRGTEPNGRLRSPSAARNRGPIADVLEARLPEKAWVLEIGSGTGEHGLALCERRPDITWRPSDQDADARASIAAWAADGPAGLLPPLEIDARAADWGADASGPFDAVVSMNMIHIAPWEACLGLLRGAGQALAPGGFLFLYGPFQRGGAHTAPSNADFDASLKARDPAWGVRDLDAIAEAAAPHGLTLAETVAMPANNLSVLFRAA